jgi:hypothetical protein
VSRRVYKFTSLAHGLSDLSDRRLKISTIDDLNDPFDWASFDTTDPQDGALAAAIVADFRGKLGLLCFSRNWDNLLLWSHYGASHTGLCLGFDLSDELAEDAEVLYQPGMLKIERPATRELASRLLRTKHECWSYEQETRSFVRLNDPPDSKGLWWMDFGTELELKEVIIGANCGPEDSRAVMNVLKSYKGVRCSWAGMRKDAFLLARQDAPPPWASPISQDE